MRALIFLLALPAFALVDSYKDVPTKLPHWKLTAQHMDTGELRGCSAAGSFDGLAVVIERAAGPAPDGSITFRYYKDGVSDRQPRTDERECGTGGAPAGTWRYSHEASADQVCDGTRWRTLTAKHFTTAALLLDGKEAAKTGETADFLVDLGGDQPLVYAYTAWFESVKGLDQKLKRSGKAALRFDDPRLKPIELSGLNLEKVGPELKKCSEGGR